MSDHMAWKRKIVYVITKSAWGGAQRYVYDLAVRLPREQFDIVVAFGGAGPLAKKLETAGIRTISLPRLERDIKPGRELAVLWRLFRLFRRERPDIVHLSSSKAGGLGAVAGRLAGLFITRRPMILYTVHGWPFAEDRPAWQRGLIFFFSWLSAAFADYVVVIDAADYRAGRRFTPEAKLILIPHGIAPPGFLPPAEARAFLMAQIGGIAPGAASVLIGVTAELTKNKGLNYLIDAVNQVKSQFPISNFQFLVFGEGEDRAILERQIIALKLEDTMHLSGFLPDAARYLKGLDVFILPSVKEGLPYAIMEAMAAGLPVIASAVGGIPDFIQSGKTGILVPPKNPAALAEAIADLIKNPAKRRDLASAAAERARERFAIEIMIKRTRALYETGRLRNS